MLITGLTVDDFESIVNKVSAEKYSHNLIMHPDSHDDGGVKAPRIRARLRTKIGGVGKYDLAAGSTRKGGTFGPERRMPTACWHTYRDVLSELFNQFPNAHVKTALANYKGVDSFNTLYPDTAYINVGSQVYPQYPTEQCDC